MAAFLIPLITSLLSSTSDDEPGPITTQRPAIDWTSLLRSYEDGLEFSSEAERERRRKLYEVT